MTDLITATNIILSLKLFSVIGFFIALTISLWCYYRTRVKSYTWLYIMLAMFTGFILHGVRLVKEFVADPQMLELIKIELIPIFVVFLVAATFTIRKESGFPTITPARENNIMVKGELFEIAEGQNYLIMEEKFSKGINMFMHSLARGYEGLFISRLCPTKVRQNYKLEKTPCIWLTETSPENTLSLGPELEKMLQVVEDFIKKSGDINASPKIKWDEKSGEFIKRSGRGVIYLGGLDYLIEHNSFERALFFVERLTDKIRVSKCSLIISVNPYILDNNQKKLLEREFNIVEYLSEE